MLNIGFVGLGKIFPSKITSIKDNKEYCIRFLCDVDDIALHKASKLVDNDVHLFSNVKDAIIKCTDTNVAIISTPIENHLSDSITFLENNVSVLCEKPFSCNINDLNKAQSIAKSHDCKFTISYHASHALDLKEFNTSRKNYEKGLGNLRAFECNFFDPYYNFTTNSVSVNLGGSYMDSAVNAISVIDKIIDISKLSVIKHTCFNSDNGIVLASSTNYSNSTGITGIINTDWTRGINFKETRLFYDNGMIVLNHSEQSISVFGKQGISIKCINKRERLHQHYIGVFDEFLQIYSDDTVYTSMKARDIRIHSLLSSVFSPKK